MDADKYTAGFNIGYTLGETNGNDDLVQRMNNICAQNKHNSFSMGFHHGFLEARSKRQLQKRQSSLSQILRGKSKNSRDRGR